VNKRVNKIKKNVDGPTQMSRRRGRPSSPAVYLVLMSELRRLFPPSSSFDDFPGWLFFDGTKGVGERNA
jgi:hypothetical protein